MKNLIYRLIKYSEYKRLLIRRKRLTAIQLKEKQEEKFLSLIRHIRVNSPYYSQLLVNRKIESVNDISKIPILTKQHIAKNAENIKSTLEDDIKNLRKNSTSGSTGAVTNFYSDLRDDRDTRAIRGDEFVTQYKYLNKQLIFWGAERDAISKNSIKYYINKYIIGKLLISTYHLTEKDIVRYVSYINKFKPKIIVGYPSALHFIALEIGRGNLKLKYFPIGIISAGESLQIHQREIIEETFKTRIYNRYGCREVGHIANECSAHDGLHYNADDLIIEVVDESGNPCGLGQIGRILITDLNNFAFPLVRYDIGDLGALSKSNFCSCGSILPKLETIEGRTFDIIHGKNGNKVSGTYWTLTLRNKIQGIEAFQIKQTLDYKIEVRIKSNNLFNNQEKNKLINLIAEKLGDSQEVSVVEVDKFEFTKQGKFKWISSELNF